MTETSRPDPTHDPAEVAPARRRSRWVRRVAIAVGAFLGVVLLAVVGFLVYLQTDAGEARARSLVVGQIANLFADDAEVSVDGVGGSFLADARLTGLEIRRDGEVVVAVDTVLVDYNLTTLLRRTFSASELYVAAPEVTVRQRADSTFNTDDLFKPAEEDEGGGGFAVRLDEVAVARGAAEVRWYRPEGPDSVHAVRDLDLVVRDFEQEGDSLSGRVEGLTAVALAPLGRSRARIAAAGAFTRGDVSLRDLTVTTSNGTALDGRVLLDFAAADGPFPVFDASVGAAPLATEDVRAFAGLPVFGDPRLRLRADSDGRALTFSLTGALGDGTLSLDGEVSREGTDGPVRTRAEGELRRFDPSEITGDPATAAAISGDLRVNLQGSSLETLSGPFRVNLTETRVGERTIDRLRLDGSFAAGRVTFDLDGALPGAALRAEGRARPFDEVPTYQLAGTAQDVDLGVLLPGSGRTDTFAGDFALIGRGRTAETISATVALDLTRAEIDIPNHRIRLTNAQGDLDIDRGVLDFDLDLTLADGDGQLAAAGSARLGDPLRYEIPAGQMTRLDLSGLTGQPSQESDLTGTFSVSGVGVDPQAAEIQFAADLRNSRYGTYEIAAGALALDLDGGTAGLDADLDFGAAGRLTTAGTLRPFADPLAYDLEGTMRNLDLGALQGNPDQTSDLTGTYRVRGAGIDPQTLALAADLQITEPSSFGDQLIDAADLAVSLDGGAFSLRGSLATPQGTFDDLALTGSLFDEAGPSIAFERACFSGIDAKEFAAASPPTRLNGCFSGRVANLGEVSGIDAAGRIDLRPSRIGEAEVEDGTVRFTLAGGALDADLSLEVMSPYADAGVEAGGRVALAFEGRPFDEVPTYALRGTTTRADLGALLDLPPDQPLRLTSAFSVEGRGADPATATATGTFSAGPSALGPTLLDTLNTRFALSGGVLAVDTLRAESDLLTARGGGTLALFNDQAPSDFRVEGSIESLAPLRALRADSAALGLESGSFALTARAEANGGPIRLVGTAEARQVIVGETAVTGLDASIDGSWNRAAADSLGLDALDGEVRASFAVLSSGSFRAQSGVAALTIDGGDLLVNAEATVDDRRDLDLGARVDLATNGVTLERGRFRIDDTTYQLLQPTTVAVDGSAYEVRGLIVSSSDGAQIAADGTVDLEGEQNLIVTVEDVAIGGLTDLANLEALGGDLSATLVLSGPASAPLIDGTVDLAGLTARGEAVGAARAEIAYADRRLGLDAELTHIDGETLTVTGSLPLAFSLADAPADAPDASERVDLRARANAFPIAWARPFLDDRGYTALGGALRLDLTIRGTQGAPRLDGVATLTDGRLGLLATGRVYDPLVADVSFQNDRIVLDDVRILEPDGRTALDIRGQVRLRELSVGELDLTIVPDDFVAMDNRTFRSLTLDRGASPLRLTGTLERPVLRGAVVLAEGDIYLTDELAPPDLEAVELTDAQIREVEARFGRVITARDTSVNRFVDALDYDLTVQIQRNVWLRSEAGLPFDIEFTGALDARKQPFADGSQLFGEIEFVRGTVETLNRQFELEGGDITFNGDPLAAVVDLTATLDARLAGSVAGRSSATITLTASGRLDDNPTIRLSSDPAMEPADIVSVIATGRLADELASTGAAQGLAVGLGLGRASSLVEGIASRSLGLEMAQIDYEGGDLVIKFGDYLSSRVFWTLGAIVPLGSNAEQDRSGPPVLATLDYELLRWLSAQTEYSGQRGVGAGLNYEVAW